MSCTNFMRSIRNQTKSFRNLIEFLCFVLRWYFCVFFCDTNLLNIQKFSTNTTRAKISTKGSIVIESFFSERIEINTWNVMMLAERCTAVVEL